MSRDRLPQFIPCLKAEDFLRKQVKTTDGSTSHYYYFMVKTQDEQTHRALTDEVTYRRERVGVTVILDFHVGGVSKQIVGINARSMQNAELQGEPHGL